MNQDIGICRTVIDCRQNQLGQTADFSPLLISIIFDLSKLDVPQIKSQAMRHTRINIKLTQHYLKNVDP